MQRRETTYPATPMLLTQTSTEAKVHTSTGGGQQTHSAAQRTFRLRLLHPRHPQRRLGMGPTQISMETWAPTTTAWGQQTRTILQRTTPPRHHHLQPRMALARPWKKRRAPAIETALTPRTRSETDQTFPQTKTKEMAKRQQTQPVMYLKGKRSNSGRHVPSLIVGAI